jgi:hypothetical protein
MGPLWLWREIRDRGPGDYLAVTSTFPLLKLKMLPEFLRFFRDTLRLGSWHAADRVFVFRDEPTRVIFGSAHNSESLESATAKGAWLDEVGQDDFRLASWEAILRRLALHRGRVLGGTTLYNLGWLKQQVYDRWRAGDPDHAVIQFDSIENPAFPREEYERARRTLPAWKFNLFYRAIYSRPAAAIYGDFVDEYREQGGHKVHPFDIPPEWPRHAGVDFGAVNTARLWLARDPEANVFYLYRESLEGGKTTAQHAAAAKAEAQGLNVLTWFGGSKSETQQRMDWQHEGVPLREPVVADVEAGIDRVIALFKAQRLFVFDSCTRTLDELGTYSREVDESGQPTEKIKDKEKFHLCFVAGTRVTTASGDLPIERVRPGMLAWTRRGWRPVVAAAQTAVASVYTVELSNGRTLTGTGDHPVWVRGADYTALRALRYGDKLEACSPPSVSSRRAASCRRSSGTAARTTSVTRTRATTAPAPTTSRRAARSAAFVNRSTGSSGSTTTAPSPPDGRSTTGTATPSTTTPATWSRSHRTATVRRMRRCGPPSRPRLYASTPRLSARSPLHGTLPRRVGNGIASWPCAPGRTASRSLTPASGAARGSRRAAPTVSASVPTPARPPHGVRRARIASSASARSAAARSRSSASSLRRGAPPRVLAVRATGRARVFNLTVADAHEYVANGVLVSNCDAFRYLANAIDQPPPAEVAVDPALGYAHRGLGLGMRRG